jgi:hypothetical protein
MAFWGIMAPLMVVGMWILIGYGVPPLEELYHAVVVPYIFLVPLLGLLDWNWFLVGSYTGLSFGAALGVASGGILYSDVIRDSFLNLCLIQFVPALILFTVHAGYILSRNRKRSKGKVLRTL